MTGQILNRLKQQVSSLELIPSGGGKFEIEVDGDLAYSKLETGEFPDESQIIKMVEARI